MAQIASRINALPGSDVYRISAPVRVVKEWQHATVLLYAPSSRPRKTPGRSGREKEDVCNRGGKLQSGSMSLIGWSDAAYEDQSTEGKWRLGHMVGLTSSTLSGPCHLLQWTSEFTRKLEKTGFGGEVYALSEITDHTLLSRDCYRPPAGLDPGMAGLGACEIPFTHSKIKEMIAE